MDWREGQGFVDVYCQWREAKSGQGKVLWMCSVSEERPSLVKVSNIVNEWRKGGLGFVNV